MKARSHHLAATKAVVSLAAEEGQNVKYIPKEDRQRTDALDPELEKRLIWLSENWKKHFAEDRSSSSASSSASWNYSWWSGNDKWYWNDDEWKEHKR